MHGKANTSETPIGVLLLNLGTPDSPSVRDVRRYLREFLSDPRVLTMHPVVRWLLLNLVILPRRPRATASAYSKIWTEAGSPLLINGRKLALAVGEDLGSDFQVELAMRYQKPAIRSTLERMQQAGAARVVVIPLFPQYSEAATGSAVAKAEEENQQLAIPMDLTTLGDFYDDAGFIEAQTETIRPLLGAKAWDHILFSYHGLPESQIRRVPGCLSDPECCDGIDHGRLRCYRAQCFATTRALWGALAPEDGGSLTHGSSFQSRLTREPWIKPYTDFVLPELYAAGKRRLLVVCPAFAADNLETLEEVGIRLREQWAQLGGKDFDLAPCVNDSPRFARAVSDWVRAEVGVPSPEAAAP